MVCYISIYAYDTCKQIMGHFLIQSQKIFYKIKFFFNNLFDIPINFLEDSEF